MGIEIPHKQVYFPCRKIRYSNLFLPSDICELSTVYTLVIQDQQASLEPIILRRSCVQVNPWFYCRTLVTFAGCWLYPVYTSGEGILPVPSHRHTVSDNIFIVTYKKIIKKKKERSTVENNLELYLSGKEVPMKPLFVNRLCKGVITL